uniref:Platelet-activating factor acetylhydrolase IB subunit alpha2 n=1 Tax=Oncorhynchus kisutch TaxID=8019 RepID=A0A8C7IEK8_ONCKI
MSGDEINPAAVAQAVEDVQGDDRWMSQIWRELFSPLHALNFGIGGDTTCNVLWRLQNGELDNIRPKVRFNWASTGPEREKSTAQGNSFVPVMHFIQIRTPNQYLIGPLQVTVVWVGTNNHEHSAEQVAGGILAIAQLLTSRLPKTKVVVLGLLARGDGPNPLREKNAAVNGFLRSWLPRLGQAQFLDVGAGFVHSDGTISTRDMFDFLHLTAAGYRAIAKPLSDLLLQILDETPEEKRASLV